MKLLYYLKNLITQRGCIIFLVYLCVFDLGIEFQRVVTGIPVRWWNLAMLIPLMIFYHRLTLRPKPEVHGKTKPIVYGRKPPGLHTDPDNYYYGPL